MKESSSFTLADSQRKHRFALCYGERSRTGRRDCFNVEFRDAKTNELLEVLEEEGARRFKSSTIMSVMDELAEDYLRTSATRWKCTSIRAADAVPMKSAGGAATSGNVEQVVIRGLPR